MSQPNSLKRNSTEIIDSSDIEPCTPQLKKRKLSLSIQTTQNIVRCDSGKSLIKTKISKITNCDECNIKINKNESFYCCPNSILNNNNNNCCHLCINCSNNEKESYTGSIKLGKRIKIKINNIYKYGSIIKHWSDDDTYTIQLDGQNRSNAKTYNIYDPFWDIYLIDNNLSTPIASTKKVLTVLTNISHFF